MKIFFFALSIAVGCSTPARAQSVTHIQTQSAGIATGVWVGAKGTPAVYGNTLSQAENAFTKIQTLLKEQGLGMGDIVMMRVYMAADPAMDNKLDFAGMNTAYAKFFGTPEQPNKPARSTVQVAALVAAGALLEVEVQAARSSPSVPTQ
ncbi:MAG: hypothetical protein DMF88_23645 [Acidobacteria bacterium]|nr:MAG: hypothetical protein DMF88_23645 [Acidobacteriota bacterium]